MGITQLLSYYFGGIFLLWIGAKWLTEGSRGFATIFGLSKFIQGTFILAFATGFPELIMTTTAAVKGHPTLTLGMIIGSNTINTLFVLGLGLLMQKIDATPKLLKIEFPFLIFSAIALLIVTLIGEVSRGTGVLFLLLYYSYLYMQLRSEEPPSFTFLKTKKQALIHSFIATLSGVLLIFFGARFLLQAAIDTAAHFAVSPVIISITLVAFGAAFAEIITSLYLCIQGNSQVSLGNIIGSNIFNTFCALGCAACFHPIKGHSKELIRDAMVLLCSYLVVFFLLRLKKELGSTTGVVLILMYALYIFSMVVHAH